MWVKEIHRQHERKEAYNIHCFSKNFASLTGRELYFRYHAVYCSRNEAMVEEANEKRKNTGLKIPVTLKFVFFSLDFSRF